MLLSSMSKNSSQTRSTLIVVPSSTKSAAGTSMPLHSPIPTCGEFESQFQLILVHHSGHGNVGEEFISTEILPKVRSDSKLAPKAIQDHFKEAYGVEISYAKARRGEERALKVIDGSHDEAYSYLPKYCQEIQRSNPESNVQLDI